MYRLMIVDDEENILNSLRRTLLRQNYWECEFYSNTNDALKRVATTNIDLILSDYRMPGMNGVEFLVATKEIQPEAIRIILSGFTDLDGLLSAINRAEIYRFINKPWHDYELIAALMQALEHRDVLVENRRLADRVRQQEMELNKRKLALEELESKHPELVRVNWGANGEIKLDETQE